MARPIIFLAGKDPVDEVGGHSSYVRAHARAAIRAGLEPHLFCVNRRGGVVTTDFGTVYRTASPFRPFRAVMAPAHGPRLTASVRRFLRGKKGPHLIHCFGLGWGYQGVVLCRQLRRQGVEARSLVSAYATAAHEVRGKLRGLGAAHGCLQRLRHQAEHLWIKLAVERCERQSARGSSRVLVNYESVRRLIVGRYGPGARIHRLPYCSEAAFLQPEGAEAGPLPGTVAALTPRDAPLVVAVSRHDPRKGLDVLLHALADLRANGVRFRACLVGGGLLLEAHRRLVARLGLSDMTAIEGRVPDSYAYLRHADVFVLPSLEEGSGSVSLLEALQARVAVVASGIDGIPEDVADGVSALLVPPGDSAALSATLGRALTSPGLRQTLVRGGREVFARRFSAAAFTVALRDTYAALGVAA